jgi:hypothetical protein
VQPAPNGRSSAKGRGGASPIPRAEDGSCAGGVLATLLQSASTRLSVCAAASSYCWQPPLNPASACAGGLHMPLASRQSLSIRAAPASGRVRAGPVSDFASDPWRSLTNAEGPPCTGRSPTAAVAVLRVTEGRSCLKWLQLLQLEECTAANVLSARPSGSTEAETWASASLLPMCCHAGPRVSVPFCDHCAPKFAETAVSVQHNA